MEWDRCCGRSRNCLKLLAQDVRSTGESDRAKSYLSEVTCRPACDQSESILSSLVRSALVPILPNWVSKSVQDAGEAGVAVCNAVQYSKREPYCAKHTFSPVPPDQFFQRVHADVVGVHLFHCDVALLQVLLIDLVRVPRSCRKQ